jgi:uncharacterized protein (TIGR04255 family)
MTQTTKAAMARMHFKNPPIMEAVIGIYIPELPETVIEDFRAAASDLARLGFESQKPRTEHRFQIKVEEGVSSFEGLDSSMGFQYVRADRPSAVQFLRNGFVFSQLGRYTSWEDFTHSAKELWQAYVKVVGPVELLSFQVRYVNKLFVPQRVPWEKYIRVYPSIPEEVPQDVLEYFLRLAMPIKYPPGRLNHLQAILPQEREGFLTMLLDNDFQFSAINVQLSDIWSKIDEVRTVKDEYFDKFLTPLMKETFDA